MAKSKEPIIHSKKRKQEFFKHLYKKCEPTFYCLLYLQEILNKIKNRWLVAFLATLPLLFIVFKKYVFLCFLENICLLLTLHVTAKISPYFLKMSGTCENSWYPFFEQLRDCSIFAIYTYCKRPPNCTTMLLNTLVYYF